MNKKYTYSVVMIGIYDYETGIYEVELDFDDIEQAINHKNKLELDNNSDYIWYEVVVNEQ